MGPDLVDGKEGSELAKKRLRAILETLSGSKTVKEACQELGIGEAMFYKLRDRWLGDAIGSLEPRELGRPRKAEEEKELGEVEKLRKELRDLRIARFAAQVREEIALVFPELVVKKKPKA
jgi:transposase-like protein